jgi:hypothetical protein
MIKRNHSLLAAAIMALPVDSAYSNTGPEIPSLSPEATTFNDAPLWRQFAHEGKCKHFSIRSGKPHKRKDLEQQRKSRKRNRRQK